jgi:hypothetical protein
MHEKYYSELKKSYSKVGDLTWHHEDFLDENISSSRSLYTLQSLSDRRPKPKNLEVYALVSGLSFRLDFIRCLVSIQKQISEILGESLHYWVEPDNLGVEYAVFKWPDDPWDGANLKIIKNTLASIQTSSFDFSIRGIQINSDGCVIAKGFDQSNTVFQIREQLKSELPFIPRKQSGWAHVPLGRILEPVGKEKFARLKRTMEPLLNKDIATTEIKVMKLVHETRWYMEEKSILAEYAFSDNYEHRS